MGGKRKFRLTCRKNWEKRKYARRKKTHSQQRSAIPLDSTQQQSGAHPPPVQPPPAAHLDQPYQQQPDAHPPPDQPSRSHKFFDCVNVTSLMKGKLKRKVFQNPYRSGKDFRLKVHVCGIPCH